MSYLITAEIFVLSCYPMVGAELNCLDPQARLMLLQLITENVTGV